MCSLVYALANFLPGRGVAVVIRFPLGVSRRRGAIARYTAPTEAETADRATERSEAALRARERRRLQVKEKLSVQSVITGDFSAFKTSIHIKERDCRLVLSLRARVELKYQT